MGTVSNSTSLAAPPKLCLCCSSLKCCVDIEKVFFRISGGLFNPAVSADRTREDKQGLTSTGNAGDVSRWHRATGEVWAPSVLVHVM